MIQKQNPINTEKRISTVLDYLLQIASGDYKTHLEPSEKEDDVDGIIYGLTTLKDELLYREKKRGEAERALKQLNETLEQQVSDRTSALERSSKELEDFAYVAAHDFKAPLTNLLTLVGMMDREQIGDEMNKDLFDKVFSAVGKLHSTVSTLNDVIAFKETLKDNKEQMSFEAVFREITESIADQLDAAQATIRTDFSQCALIDYPPVHLRSIMQNLLTNAVKYKHPDKPLEVEVRTERCGASVCLIVKDNGLGFDANKNAKVVKRLFKRLHTHVEGKGVGMYIVNSIVETQGGKIEVESEPNQGATFRIHLN